MCEAFIALQYLSQAMLIAKLLLYVSHCHQLNLSLYPLNGKVSFDVSYIDLYKERERETADTLEPECYVRCG